MLARSTSPWPLKAWKPAGPEKISRRHQQEKRNGKVKRQ